MAEMKWSHKDRMEQLWIQRELGDELFKEINQGYCEIKIFRSESHIDGYKRCDVYVDIDDEKRATWFALKFPQATAVEKIQEGKDYALDRLLNKSDGDLLETSRRSSTVRVSDRTYGQRFIQAWRHFFSR